MKIRARYADTRYSGERTAGDRGYRIYSYICTESVAGMCAGTEFMAAGWYMPAVRSLSVVLEGDFMHNSHGASFRVSGWREERPASVKELKAYLSELLETGARNAGCITDRFGMDTLNVLDADPGKICGIRGIPMVDAAKLQETYELKRCLPKLVMAVGKCGIGPEKARRIYLEQGGSRAAERLKKDPFILCGYGLSAEKCLKMADRHGNEEFEELFLKALIMETLKENESSGDIAMKEPVFARAMSLKRSEHRLSEAAQKKALSSLAEKGLIKSIGGYVYRKDALKAENDTARAITGISAAFRPAHGPETEAVIMETEKRMGIRLHENQRQAVRMALMSGVSVITGGPGTGKTTVLKVLREIHEKKDRKTMVFLAPTGRAAARMKESSGYDAYTIHKRLGISDDNLMDDVRGMIDEDSCVCDEASMLDIYVARRLFSSVRKGHQIVLLGDVNQLPPVGTGRVLQDLIESGTVPVTVLTKVYRQSSSASRIYINCQKIVKGNLQLEEGLDFEIVYSDSFKDSAEKMAELFEENVRTYGLDEVCCLCPFRRKTESGSISLNRLIQARMNPPAEGRAEIRHRDTVFRTGDRVMNRRNTADACNGDLGYVRSVDRRTGSITVGFPQAEITYFREDMDYLELAYAMSVHKSQGSEFKCCISNLLPEHGIMLQMNLFNTAVSRAKDKFILVGSQEAVELAIKNRSSIHRLSGLKAKLMYLNERQ